MRQDYVGKITLLCLATDSAGLLEEDQHEDDNAYDIRFNIEQRVIHSLIIALDL
jgi:hypothetical protein